MGRIEKILNEVGKALDYQFVDYSFMDMIDDIASLTEEEKEYAKQNVDYKVYII